MKDCYVARSRAVAARQLGAEMILMSASDSSLFNLNLVGSLIWHAADGKTLLSKIVEERICPAFDVEPSEALRDAREFVSELAAYGVLLVAESPIRDTSAGQDKASWV
jgi:Coenzyme PQQ synthesis protein D (PqqD)